VEPPLGCDAPAGPQGQELTAPPEARVFVRSRQVRVSLLCRVMAPSHRSMSGTASWGEANVVEGGGIPCSVEHPHSVLERCVDDVVVLAHRWGREPPPGSAEAHLPGRETRITSPVWRIPIHRRPALVPRWSVLSARYSC